MQIDHHSNTHYGCPHVVKDPAPMWTQDGQQGRGKLGTNRLSGEQLDINQAGMGVVRG